MSHHLLLIIHLICATIWVGGHFYLVIRLLPDILKQKNTKALIEFERKYEPLGITSLILLVVSGFWMTFQFGIKLTDLFNFSTPIERVVSIKIILLLTTVLFALSAQFRIFPSLKKSPKKLPEMAVHAVCVSLIGVALLVLGTFIRYGGF